MPVEKYFCIDNFFRKMTDLESPKKNNDCYFYYYSTCAKGDSCGFRHEPSALGSETICSFWKEGKCVNIHCNFRHMELRKNRKAIPCYWETQPVGCLKAHCPFMHQKPKLNSLEKTSEQARPGNMLSDQRKVTAVDSLVVNIEEESDNDSMPTFSPPKTANRVVTVKTLEDIRIEKIQAESAAFYSCYSEFGEKSDLRSRLAERMRNPDRKVSFRTPDWAKSGNIRPQKRLNDDQVASILGDGSLRKKRKIVVEDGDGNLKILLGRKLSASQVSVTITPESRLVRETYDAKQNVSSIKIKTLAEIRAERQRKDKEEAEVSSTSAGYNPVVDQDSLPVHYEVDKQTSPKKRIKLKRSQQAITDDSFCNKTRSDIVKTASLYRKDYDENDEDLLENELLQDSDSDDLDVSLNADEDLLLEVDCFPDK